jgi:hypothetical protein
MRWLGISQSLPRLGGNSGIGLLENESWGFGWSFGKSPHPLGVNGLMNILIETCIYTRISKGPNHLVFYSVESFYSRLREKGEAT